ncbi:hypothetical protein BCR42DRAFT_406407 [Absidia repens]|uniref:Uncharacterized protein n=1 Tax=Absidia repens TaxID=90262 RepID=A0A1X2IUR9_9FUNG|nr:hypothetical protein BCR42DRAFT_406407 [Absidia repens]
MSTSNGQDGVDAISPIKAEYEGTITVADDDPSPPNNNSSNADNMLSAVNSKDIVESLKGRIIATNKLLKCLEATKLKSEAEKQKISALTQQLLDQTTENTKLQQSLLKERMTIEELTEKLNRAHNSDNLSSRTDTVQKDLELALQQKQQHENLLSSREMYIKQLEAQIEDLDTKLKSRTKDQKKKDDSSAAIEKKDKQIKELQQELKEAHQIQESAEDDKMEMSITYEMLQRDHEELKEQIENQQKDHHSALVNHQQHQQQLQQKLLKVQQEMQQQQQLLKKPTDAVSATVPIDEFNDIRQKLQHSYTTIESLRKELESLQQSAQLTRPQSANKQNYIDPQLLAEFKRCLAENETMRKEKRVLQDKLTEQLVINDDNVKAKRNSLLALHGIDTAPLLDNPNIYDSANSEVDFEEIDYSTRLQPLTGSSTTMALDRYSSRQQPNSLSSGTSTTQAPTSMVSQERRLSQQQPLTTATSISDRGLPTKSLRGKRAADLESRPTHGTNGLLIPEPRIDRQSQSLSLRKPKLTKLERLVGVRRPAGFGVSPTTGKRKSEPLQKPRKRIVIPESSPSSSSSSSASSQSQSPPPTLSPVSDSDRNASIPPSEITSGKQKASSSMKHTTLRSTQETTPKESISQNPVEFIKTRTEDIVAKPPHQSQRLLNGMEDYMNTHLEIFLASLETIYQKMRSHGVPLVKIEGISQIHTDICAHGVDTLLAMEGCPKYIDAKEKNAAWVLWTLMSLYPKNDPYSKICKWSSENAIKFMTQGKVNLACRYVRLLVLLCKNANDRQRLAVFCYDLMRWSPRNINIISPVINIALIWPDILDLGMEREDAAGTNLIIKAIQRSCAHYCNSDSCNSDKSRDNIKTHYDYMIHLAHWPELPQTQTLQQYILDLKTVLTLPDLKVLYNVNRNAFDDLRINLIKAFELVYWRLDDWSATYNEFIAKELWNMMSDEILSHISLELMGLLARCGLSTEPENTGITTLRQTFKTILDVGNNCPEDEFPLQVIAAKCLIGISKGDLSNVRPVVQWHDQLKASFRDKIPIDLANGIKKLQPWSK